MTSSSTTPRDAARTRSLRALTAVVLATATTVWGAGTASAGTDSTAPVAGLSASAGSAYEYVTPGRVLYNGTAAGSLEVTVNATDPESGVRSVVFPSFGAGWSGGGTDTTAPYTMTYTHAAGAAAPGYQGFVVWNGAGYRSQTGTSIVVDSTPPSSSPVAYAVGTTTASSAAVTVRPGGDWGAGLADEWLERATAPGPDRCGTLSAYTRVTTDVPTWPYVDATLEGSTCYAYRYVQVDRVGNRTVTNGPGLVRSAPLLPFTSTTATMSQSGISGGGAQTVVATDPFGSGLVLAGGDVSGIARSTDGGRTWNLSNDGLSTQGSLRIAALAFSPTVPGKVYAATGREGADGGVFVSLDGGETWELRSTVPQFHAGLTPVPGAPAEGTRSVGRLLQVAPSGALFAATYDDGLMRSTDDGRTWQTLGLAGSYLRSLAVDEADPEVVYAGTYGSGLWRTTTASGAGTFTRMTAAPAIPEELLSIGTTVYAVAGLGGVWRSGDKGVTWTRTGTGAATTTEWISLDGYRDAATGRDVLYIGSLRPGASRAAVMKSTDSGTSFVSVTTDQTKMHTTVGGPDGAPWWMLASKPSANLGATGGMTLSVVVDKRDPSKVYATTWTGVFGSDDAGRDWYPYTDGLGATINPAVAADPKVPGRVYVGNMDWTLLGSTDGLRTVRRLLPPGAESVGRALALDSGGTAPVSTVYVAASDRDLNTGGEVYRSADPLGGAGWVSEGLGAATGGKRPIGLTVGRSGGSVVLLAAVEGSGVWRKVGTGAWSRVATPAMTGAQRSLFASFAWPAGGTVYLYDRESGVWRSGDAGATWTLLWAQPSNGAGGYVATPADDPTELYVSVSNTGLYRLDDASTGTVGVDIAPLRLGTTSRPGALTVDAWGRVLLSTPATADTPAQLLRSADDGGRWSAIEDETFRGGAGWASGLAEGPEGRIYTSTQGTGVLVGSGY